MDFVENLKKTAKVVLGSAMFLSALGLQNVPVKAAEERAACYTVTSIENVEVDNSDKNVVNITFNDGLEGKITFLENGIFRYNVDPTGEFNQYATVNPSNDNYVAKIQAQPDDSDRYSKPAAAVSSDGNIVTITNGETTIEFDKTTALMTVKNGSKVVAQEKEPLQIGSKTTQSLVGDDNEYFFGGGTQNGRFTHKGQVIDLINNGWVDGGVASPTPFYWSTNGYGVMRNTFRPGSYDFQNSASDEVKTTHNEKEFDAYYFVSNGSNTTEMAEELIQDFYKVTGEAALLPEYAYYLAHLNCYNRDGWTDEVSSGGWILEDGKRYNELGRGAGYVLPEGTYAESLNNEGPTLLDDKFKGVINENTYKYSARAVIDGHEDRDMPLGWFLPNDGYGCGYGQNGYYMKRGQDDVSLNDRAAAVDANVANLKNFSDYANSKGIQTGLWTQAALNPDDSEKDPKYQGFQTLRDFNKEVNNGGVVGLKTDVAWVGSGYAMALNSVKTAFDTISSVNVRPTVVSLYGWAGTQRYASIWTGDQYGGEWEYIRFHIPTYIGQGLSGNPNIGSDMNGIHSGGAIVQARDFEWKTFTQTMLDMDGWGSEAKKPYTHKDPYESINRMYLKFKAQLMPYLYTYGKEATNGLPSLRAMFLNFPDDPNTYSKNVQYQYMYGDNFLVAPVYEDVNMQANGDDVRNGIYLPGGSDQIWIDYFTGDQYRGGQTLNNFDAPLWKLPLFVKNGSIVPMYEENNNPSPVTDTNLKGLDKTKRIIEFWPAEGTNEFNLREDDGTSINFTPEEDMFTNPNYGGEVDTTITSAVEGTTATLTTGKSSGTYDGYDNYRKSTFVVNVSQKPTSIVAKNGAEELTVVEATSLEEYKELAEQDDTTVYFYDANPNMNIYAMDDEAFKDTEIINAPKLYVKFARTNVDANEQTLVINGFVNDGNAAVDALDPSIEVPTITIDEENIEPRVIPVEWNAIANATGYQIEVDGMINTILPNNDGTLNTSYHHIDLEYSSTHEYRVRTLAATGYSEWSPVVSATTSLNPWKDVPEVKATWTGGIYSDRKVEKAFNREFESSDFGFHSSSPSGGQKLTMDMGLIYNMDKLEYYPRSDKGNGTIYSFILESSLDGTTWTTVYDGSKNFSFAPTGIDKKDCATFDLTGINARYLRITCKDGTGFFSAAEIVPWKVEDSKGYALGDLDGNGKVDDVDIQIMKQYAGVAEGDTAWEQVVRGDVNNNKIYDAFDQSFTATHFATQTGAVSGSLILAADKETVKAGETYTINVYGDSMKNVNGFGATFAYQADEFAVKSINVDKDVIKGMADLSKIFTYEDGRGVATLSVMNIATSSMPEPALLKGNQLLATITVEALKDGKAYVPEEAMLFGPTNDVKVTTLQDPSVTPDVPDGKVKLSRNVFDTIKFISQVEDETLKGQEIPAGDLWQQSNWETLLFDGDTNSNLAEFKWYYGNDNIKKEVALPVDMEFNVKAGNGAPIRVVRVYNRASGNGSVTSIKATGYDKDGNAYDLGQFNKAESVFVFKAPADTPNLVKIVITPMTSTGTATGTTTGSEKNRMLSLYEVEFYTNGNVNVTDINFTNELPDTLYQQKLQPVSAAVVPSNATNKYYTITSSNPEVVKVIKVNDTYSLLGMKAGTATIKAVSAEDPNIFVEKEVSVSADPYTGDLEAVIAQADVVNTYLNIYTKDTADVFTAAYDAAKAALENKESKKAIDQAQNALEMAIANLTGYGSDEEKADSEAYIPQDRMTVVSATNYADSDYKENIIDGKTNTIWHSSYGKNAKLPVDIVVDLGRAYNLEQVDYLPRQNSHNGHIYKYRIEVSNDNEAWTPVVEGTLKHDGDALLDRANFKKIKFAPTEARYVKFVALGTLGDTNDVYASVAELEFCGDPVDPIHATDMLYEPGTLEMVQGNDAQLNVALTPEDATDVVKYTSNNTDIVTVDRKGYVLATGVGSTTITATANDQVSIEIPVNVSSIAFAGLKDLMADVDAFIANTDNEEVLRNHLIEASAPARKLTQANTEEEINAAYMALKPELTKVDTAQKQINQLHEFIDFDLTFYEGDKDAYLAEVANAEELLKDVMANLDQFAAQIDALTAARDALTYIDTTALKDVVAAADIDLAPYVDDDAKAAYVAALNAAKDALKNPVSSAHVAEVKDALMNVAGTLSLAASEDQLEAINGLIDDLNTYKVSKYTAESQKELADAKAALTNAAALYEEHKLSESEAADLITLASAIEPVLKSVDMEKAIAEAEKEMVNVDKYTISSYQALQNVYKEASALYDENDTTAENLNKKAAELRTVITELKVRAAAWILDELQSLTSKYSEWSGTFTEEEFATMQGLLDQAKVLLKKDPADIADETVRSLTFAMIEESVNLEELPVNVLRNELKHAIYLANEALNSDMITDVRPAQIKALEDAVAAGQELINTLSTDNDAIRNAVTNITKAGQELWKIVDKTALKDLIDLGTAKLKGNFTAETKAILEDAIEAAKAVSSNDDATEAEVKEAYSTLADAISGLKKPADKAALEQQIAIAEDVLANIDNYIPSTVAGLEDLLEEARAVDNDENADQKAVDAMTEKLTEANMKAKTKADMSALTDLINKVNEMNLDEYTPASVSVLRSAVAEAEKVLANNEATQEEVDAALAAVQKSVDNLQKSADVKPDDNKTPDNGGAGNGGAGSTTPSNGTSTGDATNAGALLGLLAISGCAALAMVKKKKEEE